MVTVFLALLTAQDFAGAMSCAACHSDIHISQSNTHHAKALNRQADGRWAFGTGAQAITYVSQSSEDTYLEHGLSWYRKSNGLALTPGHQTPAGVTYSTFAPDANILRCFQCHSTGTLRLTKSRTIEPAELGVRCEACHGAGAAHASAPVSSNISNPRRMTAAQINDLCGQCHRMPPAKGVATNFDNPWNTRHQPVYLSQSACFLKSEGELSCLTCHQPHTDTKTSVDSRCAACHAKPKHTSVVASGSCVRCHMPVVNPSPLLGFTNHWIGIYRLTGTGANLLRPLPQRSSR